MIKNKKNNQTLNSEKCFTKYKRPNLDSDNDGIPDEWEINGYTVEDGKIVPWDEECHLKNGYTKYQSDPFNSHSSGDPYSDKEKVLGLMGGGVLPEAHHPLVAAYPVLTLKVEKLILTNAFDIAYSKDERINYATHLQIEKGIINSDSSGYTLGGSVGGGVGGGGVSANISGHAGHENSVTVENQSSNTNTTTESKEQTWSKKLGLNMYTSAFLSANIRYLNIGTAPIFEAAPTLNFVLGLNQQKNTIATISAKNNVITTVLIPGQSYPSVYQNPIIWNTSDDFNSQPIALNINQVDAFEKGAPLEIQLTQTSGFYKKYNLKREAYFNENQQWEYVTSDIINRTAKIVVLSPDFKNLGQRHIAARKEKNYENQSLPEINLGQALKIAFDLEAFNNECNDEGDEFYFDLKTNEQFDTQLKKMEVKNRMNVNLMQGMNITMVKKYKFNKLIDIISTFLNKFTEENPWDLSTIKIIDNDFNLTMLDGQYWFAVQELMHNIDNNYMLKEDLIEELSNKFNKHNFENVRFGVVKTNRLIPIYNNNNMVLMTLDFEYQIIRSLKTEEKSINEESNVLQCKMNFKNVLQDKELLKRIENFFNSFNEQNRISLKEYKTTQQWQEVIPYLKNLLMEKFGKNIFRRIHKFEMFNWTELINDKVKQDGFSWKEIFFSVGTESTKSTIYYKDISL